MQKIMFNDDYGLTQAVLEGRKTMTRRVVPECRALDILRLWERNEGAVATGYEEKTQSFRFDYCPDKKRRFSIDHLNLIPRYKVGEIVAVAQSYREIEKEIERDGLPLTLKDSILKSTGYRNKMYVRADLMPHQIRITNVWVERLQDISNEDCMREGVRKLESQNCPTMFTFDEWRFKNKVNRCTDSPKEAFEDLFKKLSGKEAWDRNPWVYVYEFELVK